MKPRLQVMKFGGTSVGDASCVARTAQIIAKAATESGCVAVVSAMSGVTNRLIEAAKNAQTGDTAEAAAVVDALRKQHEIALTSLLKREEERARIRQRLEEVLAEGRRLCEGTALLRELTPRTLDAISSLGERLSAPLVAAAVRELGLPSEAIEATELIVTDAFHGGAEPQMELTRSKSQARLRPLLEKGIAPVVTGFIGATAEGKLTTLGRGGSDYSATILGAAMYTDEVIAHFVIKRKFLPFSVPLKLWLTCITANLGSPDRCVNGRTPSSLRAWNKRFAFPLVCHPPPVQSSQN